MSPAGQFGRIGLTALDLGAVANGPPTKVDAEYVLESLGSDMRADVLRYAEEARLGTELTFDESVMVGLRRWQKEMKP